MNDLQDAANKLLTEQAPPGEQQAPAQRQPDGRFAPGNQAAWRHGARSMAAMAGVLPGQAAARAALQERAAAIVADLGGPDSLSALARGAVERHVRLEMVADTLFERLQETGLLTAKGRTRAALSGYLSVVDRLHRSAQLLGLERRARRVPSLAEVMADGE